MVFTLMKSEFILNCMIIHFTASIDFTKVQYNSGDKMNRLLLCFPWESDKEVYRWINAPEPAVTNMYEHRCEVNTFIFIFVLIHM